MIIEGKLHRDGSGGFYIRPKKEIETVIRRALKYYKNLDIMITKGNREIIDNLLKYD